MHFYGWRTRILLVDHLRKRLSSEHKDDSIAYASDEVEGKPEAEQDAEVDEPDTEVEGKPDAEPDAEELDAEVDGKPEAEPNAAV